MRLKILCRILITAALGALSVSGLAGQTNPSVYATRTNPSAKPRTARTIDPKSAYTEKRWIGLLRKGGQCPPVAGWAAAPLLAQPKAAADRSLYRALGLDRFCVYTATPDSPQPFVPPAGLVAAPDRMALAASAEPDELDQAVGPVLAEHFRQQTGEASLALASAAKPRVRLTFVDSQPTGDDVPAAPPAGSRHGYALAQLARELVCGESGPCAARIASRRALGYVDLPPREPLPPNAADQDMGGHVGVVSDLAVAIVEEIQDWRQKGDTRHLVLNLSLGWDGELFGDLDARRVSRLEPSVQAVYGALRYAARQGVLVIAAAGNRRGGPQDSRWPLLPAAWELRRPAGCPLGLGRKLVYAVAGVDWEGLSLPNYRRGGRPRRVAYGDHAVTAVGDGITPIHTPIYTGTSVSAAVVSSIAAVVWDLRPELRPAEVMRLIGRSGDRLDARADFYPWRDVWPLSSLVPAPRMRRLSLCAAVTRACDGDAARCPALASAPVCHPWDKQPPALAASFSAPRAMALHAAPFTVASHPASLPSPCDPGTRLATRDGHVPAAPCPTDQFVSAANERWVLPQPGDDPCPGCTLIPPPRQMASLAPGDVSPSSPTYYALELQISPTWRTVPAVLSSAMLELDCTAAGRGRTTYPIAFVQASADLQTVTGLGDGDTLTGCTALLSFVAAKDGVTMSIQNPVVVDP